MTDDITASTRRNGSADGWRATLLARRQVVNVRLGHEMGRVVDIVFDPDARQICGLLFEPAGRESAFGEFARRAFGGSFGLTYVGVDHIIALDADVVTVDLDPAEPPSARSSTPHPRLSAVLGFAVVTIQGRWLGRLADLLLDATGRHVLAYLVAPETRAGVRDRVSLQRVAAPQALRDSDGTEDGSAEAPNASDASAPPTAAPLVIPASEDVRVGRDLIIVAGRPDIGTPTHGAAVTHHGTPRLDDAERAANNSNAPTWQRWESDAPTEQVHH